MIRIFADSTLDLDIELRHSYNIEVIPLTVTMKDRQYKDGLEIDTQQLFDYVRKYGTLPVTSAITTEEFVRAFEGQDEIIYISISSKLSECYQNAIEAVRQLGAENRIHVIDSLNITTGTGILVLRAAEMRNFGLRAAEIEERVQALVPKVRIAVLIDTLEYLRKGGRASTVNALVSNILKIRPILQVNPDGTLGVREKVNGPRIKAIQALIDGFKRDVENMDSRWVFITHTGCLQDAYWLRGVLRGPGNSEEIRLTMAGAVIASHTGPNGIAVIYLLK
jgi:DegV family protein with EDD domain